MFVWERERMREIVQDLKRGGEKKKKKAYMEGDWVGGRVG